MRYRWLLLVLLSVVTRLLVPGIAAVSTAAGAETRVRGIDVTEQALVGAETALTLELHPGCGLACDEVASASLHAPRGGTYKLNDPETGQVRRTGFTNDLDRREYEHGRGAETEDLKCEVDKRTDDPVARRGREQIIHDQHPEARAENGGFNRRNPISPTNPRRDEYLEAGRRSDDQ
ncbi:MAG: GIY-YIG nuclease family protein [Planctomycetota bacterium]